MCYYCFISYTNYTHHSYTSSKYFVVNSACYKVNTQSIYLTQGMCLHPHQNVITMKPIIQIQSNIQIRPNTNTLIVRIYKNLQHITLIFILPPPSTFTTGTQQRNSSHLHFISSAYQLNILSQIAYQSHLIYIYYQ